MAATNGTLSKPAFAAGPDFKAKYGPMWDRLVQGASKNPHRPALIVVHQKADHFSEVLGQENGVANGAAKNSADHLVWSYNQLQNTSERLAAAFVAQGVRPGSTVVTFLWGSVEFALVRWAAMRLRCRHVPLDPRIIQRKDALQDYIKTIEPDLLVATSTSELRQAEALGVSALSGVPVKAVAQDDSQPEGQSSWPSLSSLLRNQQHAKDLQPVSTISPETPPGDAPIALLFTSGSTGRPKGCEWTETTLLYALDMVAKPFGFDENSVYTVSLPAYRGPPYGFSAAVWMIGGTVVYPAALPSPQSILDAASKVNGTHLEFSPALINVLTDLVGEKLPEFPALKQVGLGGDIITVDTMQKVQRVFQPEVITPLFGMTEGVGTIVWSRDSKVTYFGSVCGLGPVTPGSKVKICVPGTRDLCKRGETGALHQCSPGMIKGYLEGREPEAFYVDDEGPWIITGDQAVMDDEGVIYVMGRFKDVIKSRGLSLSPVLIESVVAGKFEVTAKVVAVPEATVGTVPVVIIKPSFTTPTVDKEKVKEAVVRDVGPDARPKEVLMLSELGLDEFPMNASGKVSKPDLTPIVFKHLGITP